MAEAVLLAISKIGIAVGEEVTLAVIAKLAEKATNLKELPDNFRIIEGELSMMHDVILDLDTMDLSKNAVKGWIAQLRKLAFRVEDVVDKYSYHASQLQEEGFATRIFRGAHHTKVFMDVADEAVRIIAEIEQVKKLRRDWLPIDQLVPKRSAEVGQLRSQFSFPTHVQDEDLVGIRENRNKLIEWLASNEQQSTVITVSGMGGLGKSSLVANVYDRVKGSFGISAWIVVSQRYTIGVLLRELLRKIGHAEKPLPPNMDVMENDELKEEIRLRLEGRGKCLVVLDDVWDRNVYGQMEDVFQALQSSRVIITTRMDDIASVTAAQHHLQLKPLDDTDSFHLFCARAFNHTAHRKCPPELEGVAGKIVKRCKGLPLAIVSMASLMSSKKATAHAWNQVYNQFQSEITKTDNVQAILKVSYNDLPANLRNCFLYCSLFPEDYTMSRESLVRQWVAEGFVRTNEENTPEDVAELNLMELISRNMLQVEEHDELDRVSTCKMHDLVRELALSIAKEEKFGSANDRGAMIHVSNDVRRLASCGWTDHSSSSTESSLRRFEWLRTLMSLEATTLTTQMLASIFSGSRYLTVLELQDSAITELPASVVNLFNLRYIGLRRTEVKSLPNHLDKLSNLQTLDIKQTKIEKLPPCIVKIRKLRHLLADRVIDEKQQSFQYFIGVQPPKELSNLVELQTLETVEASDHLADQLARLNKLQSVWIGNVGAAHSAKLFATLSKMPLLSSLLLNAVDEKQPLCLEALKPESKKLHRLIVRGRWAAEMPQCPVFQGHGINLKYLALSWSGLQEDPLLLLAPHVPNLTYLSLNRVSNAEILVVSEGCFPRLKTLVLKNLPNVNELVIGQGAFQSIEGLYVVCLPRLDKIPENIEHLRSLKKLWLFSLHRDFKAQWVYNGMDEKMGYVLELKM